MSSSLTRASGMISGIDTESVVQAYVSTYVEKKNKMVQSQTKLSYKQDAWKDLNTKVYSLYNKVGSLRFSTSYNLKKTTVSDSTKASVSASSNAVIGTQTLSISKLAKAGYLTGAQLASGTKETTTLADLGYGDGDTTISLKVGSGSEKTISISGSSTIENVIDELKKAGVNASYDASNRRIFVSSKNSGASNDFSLTANSAEGNSALNALGLLTMGTADKQAYATKAAYAMATDGQSYYELDASGNIQYNEDGTAKVRDGAVYDSAATKANISTILQNLATAYADNVSLSADNSSRSAANSELQSKIEYSNARDAVLAADTDLIDLLKAQTNGATLVGDDGNTYNSEDDVPDNVTTTAIADAIKAQATTAGLITTSTDEDGNIVEDTTAYDELLSAYNKYVSYGGEDYYNEDTSRYLTTDERTDAETTIATNNAKIAENNAAIAENNTYISNNSYWDVRDYSSYYSGNDIDTSTGSDFDNLVDSIVSKIDYAHSIIENGFTSSTGATRVSGEDAAIKLNGADYTSSSNSFSINGLNINATGITTEDITITTTQDTQGIYDKIKDFLSTYNELINEMQSLYNADSAKGYEPLTEDQKEAMSDKEVEKWEDKIKSAILRRDSSLGTLINKMTSAMSKPISLNGRSYSLSDFGIQTLGYINAAKNEQYAYHIYGDADDSTVSGKTDKLMSMINSDPDTVIEYMQDLSSQLYKAVGNEMKSSNLRTAYTVYNDKQMAKEYSTYTKNIKSWETKISDMEDRYYKKFSAMESALAKLQSSTSSLSSLFGN